MTCFVTRAWQRSPRAAPDPPSCCARANSCRPWPAPSTQFSWVASHPSPCRQGLRVGRRGWGEQCGFGFTGSLGTPHCPTSLHCSSQRAPHAAAAYACTPAHLHTRAPPPSRRCGIRPAASSPSSTNYVSGAGSACTTGCMQRSTGRRAAATRGDELPSVSQCPP